MRKGRLLLAVLVLFVAGSGLGVFAQGLTAQDFVNIAKALITEISVDEAKALLDKGGYVFVDVREPNETGMGHIPGAVMIPRGLLEFQIASKVPDKSAKIVIYCKSGGRGSLATYTLVRMGYTNSVNVAGGWDGWSTAGYPVE